MHLMSKLEVPLDILDSFLSLLQESFGFQPKTRHYSVCKVVNWPHGNEKNPWGKVMVGQKKAVHGTCTTEAPGARTCWKVVLLK